MAAKNGKRRLRSQAWWDNSDHPEMTALYLERFLNFGLTRQELQSGRPIIGIAQTGNDLVPCNRHHLQLAERVKEGIRDAGGSPSNSPSIRSRRPASDRRQRWIATSPTSGWWRFSMDIPSTAWCSRPAVTRRYPPVWPPLPP